MSYNVNSINIIFEKLSDIFVQNENQNVKRYMDIDVGLKMNSVQLKLKSIKITI